MLEKLNTKTLDRQREVALLEFIVDILMHS